jgi:hypothetical protein
MGKYKQWLHHQEIGRRLRDQINTLEQERGRVQKMAPAHPTALPELENPIIAALLAYTRAGNRLSNIDVIKAAMPKLGPDLEQRRPASSIATPGAAGAAAPMNEAVVASLLARADSIPADPLGQMQALSGTGGAPGGAGAQPDRRSPLPPPPPGASQAGQGGQPGRSNGGQSRRVDSVGGWLQRHRSDE